MTNDHDQQALIDLGAASKETLGAQGNSTDLVREIPSATGISDE